MHTLPTRRKHGTPHTPKALSAHVGSLLAHFCMDKRDDAHRANDDPELQDKGKVAGVGSSGTEIQRALGLQLAQQIVFGGRQHQVTSIPARFLYDVTTIFGQRNNQDHFRGVHQVPQPTEHDCVPDKQITPVCFCFAQSSTVSRSVRGPKTPRRSARHCWKTSPITRCLNCGLERIVCVASKISGHDCTGGDCTEDDACDGSCQNTKLSTPRHRSRHRVHAMYFLSRLTTLQEGLLLMVAVLWQQRRNHCAPDPQGTDERMIRRIERTSS